MGVKGGAEGHDMLKFLEGFFRPVLGVELFDSSLVIDVAHSSLSPKPGSSNQQSSAIIVHLHHYKDKVKILDTSRAKDKLMFQGAPAHMFLDMNPEVSHPEAAYPR